MTAPENDVFTHATPNHALVVGLFARMKRLGILDADVARAVPELTTHNISYWRGRLEDNKTVQRMEAEKRSALLSYMRRPDSEVLAEHYRTTRPSENDREDLLLPAIARARKLGTTLTVRGHGRAVVMTDTLAHQVERGQLSAEDAVALAWDIAEEQKYSQAERAYVREWAGEADTE